MSLSSIMSGNVDPTPPAYKTPYSEEDQLSTKSPRQSAKSELAPGADQSTPIALRATSANATPSNSSKLFPKKMSNGHSEKPEANGDRRYAVPNKRPAPPEKPKPVRPDAQAVMMAMRDIEDGADDIVLNNESDWRDAWLRYNRERREADDHEERRQRKVCL
jgi:hypothetical protein